MQLPIISSMKNGTPASSLRISMKAVKWLGLFSLLSVWQIAHEGSGCHNPWMPDETFPA